MKKVLIALKKVLEKKKTTVFSPVVPKHRWPLELLVDCTADQINQTLWGQDPASVFLNLLGGANMQTSFRSNV